MKVCILAVYFGKLPNYFPLWLKSCTYNKDVQFFLITDQLLTNLPCNVQLVQMSLDDMRYRASQIVGFQVALRNPYKCCDYRPAYGLIFSDIIAGFDYWGHCDLDMIFGDLQFFFKKFELQAYDKFLALGHLSLYRNRKDVNNIYKLEGGGLNYKEVFTTEENRIFDEVKGIYPKFIENGFTVFTRRIFIDIATIYHRYRIIEQYNLDEKPKNLPSQVFVWEKGHVYHEYFENGECLKKEYIYIHFQKRPNYDVFFDVGKSDAFYITNKGFFRKDGDVKKNEIDYYNYYHGKLYENIESSYKMYKRMFASKLINLKKRFGLIK